ncbi:MAG: TadE/TadG family type IV pilus assembly protein [Dehalococcoidia bacterium]
MMSRILKRPQPRANRLSAIESGQALVEFALVSVLFFMLLFGIFDSIRLLQSWVTVQHAARESARYAITGQVACPEFSGGNQRVACTVDKAKSSTTGIPGGGSDSTSVSVTYKYWDYPAFSGSGATGLGEPCDQVEIAVSYRHHFATPIIAAIVPGGVDIVGRQRMTNEPFGSCS